MIRTIIYNYYESAFNEHDIYGIIFCNISSVIHKYSINSISDSTKNYINKAVITFFEKVKEVYSESNLKDRLYET